MAVENSGTLVNGVTESVSGSFGYRNDFSGLYEKVTLLIKDYLHQFEDRDSKVVEFHTPNELRKLVDLSLPEEGIEEDEIMDLCKKTLQYCVHVAHPRFYNQIFSGVDPVGLVGQFLTSAINTSMYTFEMGSVLTLMEADLLQKMREMIGWTNGDGIFSPGGSVANLYGLLVSRYHKFPETRDKGVQHLPKLIIFISEQGHYSIRKFGMVMGMGLDGVVAVKCDDRGKMDVVDLEKKITEANAQGYAPYAVVATAGTTVLAAFDSLNPIADVCQKYGLWLHVDAAFGGCCLYSEQHRSLMAGSERADSVTWDIHKSLSAPLQCSAFITKHKGILSACNSTKARYLFQQDKQNYDISYDTGDKSIQCGRLNDVLKFWLMWKAKGTRGFERHMDNSIHLAKYLAKLVCERDGFELLLEPEYTSVSFWYIPPSLRNCTDQEERREKLGKVAPFIKAKMVQEGKIMIGYQPLDTHPNFFRMICTAPHGTESDMEFILNEIERLGMGL